MDVSGVTSSGVTGAQAGTNSTTAAADSDFSTVLNAAAAETVESVPAMQVDYLDAATGQTKTGYVIGDGIYEDAAGTVPASDYSQFRKADGLLYIRTPYGTLRKSDFNVLLQKQQEYDVATYGEPVFDVDKNHIGTFTADNRITDPLSSYTSAPGGPGTISQEIWDQYYTEAMGSTTVTTVDQVLTESVGTYAVPETSTDAKTSETSCVSASGVNSSSASTGATTETDISTSVAAMTYVAAAVSAESDNAAGGASTDSGQQSGAVSALLNTDQEEQIATRVAANRKALLQRYINTMMLDNDL